MICKTITTWFNNSIWEDCNGVLNLQTAGAGDQEWNLPAMFHTWAKIQDQSWDLQARVCSWGMFTATKLWTFWNPWGSHTLVFVFRSHCCFLNIKSLLASITMGHSCQILCHINCCNLMPQQFNKKKKIEARISLEKGTCLNPPPQFCTLYLISVCFHLLLQSWSCYTGRSNTKHKHKHWRWKFHNSDKTWVKFSFIWHDRMWISFELLTLCSSLTSNHLNN